MRRPTRTRRLSIAATISFAMFVVVGSVGVRSFWITDELDFGPHQAIGLNGGCLYYAHTAYTIRDYISHFSGPYRTIQTPPGILGFVVWNQVSRVSARNIKVFRARIPLWFPLLLLLVAPVRWLIARRANVPAFPVITDAKQA